MKAINFFCAIALSLAYAGTAFAIPISIVGEYDTVLAQTSLGRSGAPFESAWIESELGYDITYTQFGDESGGESGNWEAVTGAGAVEGDYAYYLGQAWDYVLVNVGGGRGAGAENTHYLLQNNVSTDYLFLNLGIFGPDVSLSNIGIISHVGAAVPIPGALVLFGTALGLFGLRSRMQKKAAIV